MSKIGTVVVCIQEIAESLGIDSDIADMTDDEKQAVKAELQSIIKKNSCELNCPHRAMLALV